MHSLRVAADIQHGPRVVLVFRNIVGQRLPQKCLNLFLVGILVFLSGHIFYLAAVLPRCPYKLACILAGAVLTALMMVWIFRQITAKKAFKIFGLFYIGAIMILNCVAVSNLIADILYAVLDPRIKY